MATKNRFFLRRLRSSSFTTDADPPGVSPPPAIPTLLPGPTLPPPSSVSSDVLRKARVTTAHASSRCRTFSNNYLLDCCMPLASTELEVTRLAGHEMIARHPHCFPFQALSSDIKLLIFSLLSPAERGRSASVCHEWAALMRSPDIWSDLDLTSFPPPPRNLNTGGGGAVGAYKEEEVWEVASDAVIAAYDNYKRRTTKYLSYLVSVRPTLHRLQLSFDIGDARDGWLDILTTLLRAAQCDGLEWAVINWTETTGKPCLPENNSSATWCATDCKDLLYRHRHRQRFFVKFFDLFSSLVSVSLTTLTLPFDWTDRSLRALARLNNLRALVLQKYFVFQALEQSLLDLLFQSVPMLRSLTMEVWTPCGRGLRLFSIQSAHLQLLDVSACRGFYLHNIELPELHTIKVSNQPLNGPLISSDGLNIPCLSDTLAHGAPCLARINNHNITDTPKTSALSVTDAPQTSALNMSNEDKKTSMEGWGGEGFEEIMRLVCACPRHSQISRTLPSGTGEEEDED